MAYKVIIIEDDPMVASIDRQYVETNLALQVDGVFKNAGEGFAYLMQNDADLVILDYYTPVMNGMEFSDRLRELESPPSIIMVTSANDINIIRGLMFRGVLDYLVKPFEYARFKQAIDKFLQTKMLLESGQGNLNQHIIDQLMSPLANNNTLAKHLVKGIQPNTLDLIRNFLSSVPETAYTSEQIADQVRLSRITVRRYVNYMIETGEITSSVDYQTGGRPSIKYQYLTQI